MQVMAVEKGRAAERKAEVADELERVIETVAGWDSDLAVILPTSQLAEYRNMVSRMRVLLGRLRAR
jgi:hypothetical protein